MPTSPRALTMIYRADVGISPYNTNKIQMPRSTLNRFGAKLFCFKVLRTLSIRDLFHIKMYKSCISDQNIVGGVKREKTIKQDQRK